MEFGKSFIWFYWTPGCGWKGAMNYGLSVRPSVFLFGSFLGIGSLAFSATQRHVRDPHVLLWVTERGFFCRKNGENGPKIGLFGFIEKFSHYFFWIWSIKKVHIICCILALIPYLGKIWFLRYQRKCSRWIRLQDF